MVVINGKEFVIYDLDTIENVLDRIAAELNTLPKFIYFKDFSKLPSIEELRVIKINIQVEDLYNFIKDNNNNGNFLSVYDKIKDKITQQNVPLEEIVKIYIIYNNQFFNQCTL